MKSKVISLSRVSQTGGSGKREKQGLGARKDKSRCWEKHFESKKKTTTTRKNAPGMIVWRFIDWF